MVFGMPEWEQVQQENKILFSQKPWGKEENHTNKLSNSWASFAHLMCLSSIGCGVPMVHPKLDFHKESANMLLRQQVPHHNACFPRSLPAPHTQKSGSIFFPDICWSNGERNMFSKRK